MDDAFIGTILMFAGNFAPVNWAFCDGALLAIAQYQALFSILGTTYGGNGTTNFGLPDLRGRVPVHVGGSPGPGLSPYVLGEQTGVEHVSLTLGQLPAHAHTLTPHQHAFAQPASAVAGRSTNPNNAVPALTTAASYAGASDGSSKLLGGNTGEAGGGNTGIVGSSLPVSVIQPVLGINYIICLNGIYPSRS